MPVRILNLPLALGFDRARQIDIVDWLAVALAVSLPWSTSVTSVLAIVWLAAVLPTLEMPTLRRDRVSAAALLPVVLWLLAAVGMLWADAAWVERLSSLSRFHRLLFVPLLFMHFHRSERGFLVLGGFLTSALGVLLLSWLMALTPFSPWRVSFAGVPVKEYITQSTEFLACAFGLLLVAAEAARRRRLLAAAGLAALALFFLADIFFVVTSRATLVAGVALLLLLAWREFGFKGVAAAAAVAGLAATALWFASPLLRSQVTRSVSEFHEYRDYGEVNSTGLHLDFVRKSLGFVETAPIFGHGTGSLQPLFAVAAAGRSGAAGERGGMPHNQVLSVAVQIGLVGAIVLVAMWAAHFLLFTGSGLAASIGAMVVMQNVVSSLFDSSLFAFNPGWLYVLGVGVAGGMVLRQQAQAAGAAGAAAS